MTHEKKRININGRWSDSASAAAAAADEAATPLGGAPPEDFAPESAADPADPSLQQAGGEVVLTAEQMLADIAAERDGYLDSLMRLQAEFDNYRRRSQRELNEARGRSRASLIGEFLPVFDNLTRALDAAEHHEEGKVLSGVRLTHNVFADLLRKEGVTELDPIGAPFDPLLHEAIASIPSDEEEGVVIQVLERGYAVGDTVLRPARVAVSAGPGAAPEAEE